MNAMEAIPGDCLSHPEVAPTPPMKEEQKNVREGEAGALQSENSEDV